MGGCINKSKNAIIKKSNKPIIQNQNHFSKIKRKSRISTFKKKEFKQIDLSFHTCYSVDITNEIKDMDMDIKSHEDYNCKTFEAILEYF